MSSPIAYHARKDRIHLRIVAQHLKSEPGDDLKVVVQAVEHGRPIAEDPLHTERMTPLGLVAALSISMAEGWDVEPWGVAA